MMLQHHLSARAKRVDAVIDWLRPMAEPVEQEAEFACWVAARNASPDQSEDWCRACARAEVDRLNALHPEHEYLVDGGWGSSTDSPPYCCKCGKLLSDHLTEYAIRDEVEHYMHYPVCLRGKSAAGRAFEFAQLLISSDFNVQDPHAWSLFCRIERMKRHRETRARGISPSLQLSR